MRNSVHDDEHLLTTEHQVECCERAHIMANRVQYSRGYFYFYGLLIALNVFLLAWVFVEADYPLSHAVKFWVFTLLDGAVTLLLGNGLWRHASCAAWGVRGRLLCESSAAALITLVAGGNTVEPAQSIWRR